MKFQIHKALAVAAAVAIIAPVAAAFAAPVAIPDPKLPALPAALPLPTTLTLTGTDCKGKAPTAANPNDKCTLKDLLPATVLPDPNAVLAMLQGQIQLIAAALKQEPGELLNTVLGTEIPSVGSITMTVNELLNRLAGTKVFDASSLGVLGMTEISVGNVSHAYSMNFSKPAVSVTCLPAQSDNVCKSAANNPRALELPQYTVHQTEWTPDVPVLIPALIPGLTPENSILGTAIALPLVAGLAGAQLGIIPAIPAAIDLPFTGLFTQADDGYHLAGVPSQVCTKAPLPAICQGVTDLIKANAAVLTLGKGKLSNIRIQGLQTTDSAGVVAKKGVHGGGQIPGAGLAGLLGSSYSNIDTAWRGLPADLLSGSLLSGDKLPVWVPLISGTSALVDNGIDFLGLPISTDLTKLSTRTCSGNGSIATETVGEDTIRTATFPISTCSAKGSFVGFGIAVYGDHAPVNFETDLAPLWGPPPVTVDAVSNALTAVLAALAPSIPSPLTVLTYSLGLAGLVDTTKILGLTDTLPIPAIPGLPAGLPALPVALP